MSLSNVALPIHGAVVVLALLLAPSLPAQPQSDTATAARPPADSRIVGRVIDASNGGGLTDVQLQIVGTQLGTMSGVDGRFTVIGLSAGTYSLSARRIGYAPKTVTGIVVGAGQAVEQNITLSPAAVQLMTEVVTASAERGSVNAALDAQRTATNVVSSIGAEQISRSPDSDAAQAVQRVSGVTVQDGKYVFVRGLGERYTTTSLNGARLPSPEPERKVVPLDLFPANLLEAVTTSKTFTPDQPGDFSGAAVNLKTREFPTERELTYSVSAGYNASATGKHIVGAPRSGLEWLGFGVGPRELPGSVAAAGDFSQSYTPSQYNRFVGAFRNNWSAQLRSGAPTTSTSVSLGGTDPVLGHDIGYIGSFTYSRTQEIRRDEMRAFAIPTSGGGTAPVDRFDGSTGRESILWGGLLNLSTLVGQSGRLTWNNTYSRSADSEARAESGLDENSGLPFDVTRLRYVARSVFSSQLAGEHELGMKHRITWALTGAGVSRLEPDRSEVVYARDTPAGTPFLFGGNEAAVRTFGDLKEYSANASGDYAVRFGTPGREHLLKVGALVRYTTRDSRVDSYSLQASLPREDRELAPEVIFGSQFTSSSDEIFNVVSLAQGGSYDAEDLVGAGYAMAEYQLSDRYRLVGGARVEVQRLLIDAQATFGASEQAEPTYTDVLPAVALNVRLSDDHTLRFSASQTLARPEYREIVALNSRDVIGGEQFRGNPNLRRTLIQNADLRWEWYPDAGEVVSVALFAKHFADPIERVYRGTSGTRVTTFENAESALNYGAEVELRKNLGFIAAPLTPVTFFTNATVMESEIEIGSVGAGSVEPKRAMVGQAPYVVNAGLTVAGGEGRFSATTLYNIVGRRVYAASLLPLPSVFEEARHVLDLSVRFPIAGSLSAKLDAKNLLDAPYEVTQGTVQREYYRAGRTFGVGFSWRP